MRAQCDWMWPGRSWFIATINSIIDNHPKRTPLLSSLQQNDMTIVARKGSQICSFVHLHLLVHSRTDDFIRINYSHICLFVIDTVDCLISGWHDLSISDFNLTLDRFTSSPIIFSSYPFPPYGTHIWTREESYAINHQNKLFKISNSWRLMAIKSSWAQEQCFSFTWAVIGIVRD